MILRKQLNDYGLTLICDKNYYRVKNWEAKYGEHSLHRKLTEKHACTIYILAPHCLGMMKKHSLTILKKIVMEMIQKNQEEIKSQNEYNEENI